MHTMTYTPIHCERTSKSANGLLRGGTDQELPNALDKPALVLDKADVFSAAEDRMAEDSNNRREGRRRLPAAANMGIGCASAILLFGGVGYVVDRKRGDGVAFMIGGLFMGLFYCGYELWKLVRAVQRDTDD
jgi:F0F1-type ATP synthase assembly protein I